MEPGQSLRLRTTSSQKPTKEPQGSPKTAWNWILPTTWVRVKADSPSGHLQRTPARTFIKAFWDSRQTSAEPFVHKLLTQRTPKSLLWQQWKQTQQPLHCVGAPPTTCLEITLPCCSAAPWAVDLERSISIQSRPPVSLSAGVAFEKKNHTFSSVYRILICPAYLSWSAVRNVSRSPFVVLALFGVKLTAIWDALWSSSNEFRKRCRNHYHQTVWNGCW